MKIFRPLWEDGAALAPQQFQQQARWNAHIADTVARMGISHPWGVVNAEFDTAALALSRLNATRLVVRFQDGTIVDTELADNLPPVCDLSAANGSEMVEVVVALPLLSASGGNLDNGQESERPRRWKAERVVVQELAGHESGELSILRNAITLRLSTQENTAYRDKPGSGRLHEQKEEDDESNAEPENESSMAGCGQGDENILPEARPGHSVNETNDTPAMAATEPFLNSDPLFNTPESLASLIDQTAWELAGNAGLEYLVSSTESGMFDIASPTGELSNEGKIYWQLLSFLAGKLQGSAVIWRQMLTGSAATPAGFNEDTLTKFFQLILCIRHLYEKQHQGDKP